MTVYQILQAALMEALSNDIISAKQASLASEWLELTEKMDELNKS